MFGNNKNDKRPIIQTSGYNGSEPTRICPNCMERKSLSVNLDIGTWGMEILEINHGVKVVGSEVQTG